MDILSNLININSCANQKIGTENKSPISELLHIGESNRFNSLPPEHQIKLCGQMIAYKGDPLEHRFSWIIDAGDMAFYRGFLHDSGELWAIPTKGKEDKRESSGFPFPLIELLKKSEAGGNGIWIKPNYFGFQPVKGHEKGSYLLFFESDFLSLDEQKSLILSLADSGLFPYFVVFSGGASYHVFYLIEFSENIDYWEYLSKLFIPLGADPNVQGRFSNNMRMGGFFRASKGKYQSLEYANPDILPYSLDAIIEAFRLEYAKKGLAFQEYEDYKASKKSYSEDSNKPRLDYLASLAPSIFHDLLSSIIKDLAGASIGKNSYSYIRDLFWGLCHICGADLALDYFQSAFPNQRDWGVLAKDSARYNQAGIPSIIKGMEFFLGHWELPPSFADSIAQAKAKNNSFDIEKWQAQKYQEWKNLKSLSASQIINQPFVSDLDIFLDGKIILIKSMLGTGKSTLIMAIMDKLYRKIGAFYCTHRNTLGLNFQATSGGRFIHIRFDAEYLKSDPTAWLLGCLDSFKKVPLDWWEGKIIILDEVVSVLNHLLFSATISDKRLTLELIEIFSYIIKSSRGILCLDGHLADYITAFFDAMKGDKSIEIIDNIYAGGRPDIIFLRGAFDGEKIKERDYSPLISHALESIKYRPIIIFSDNKAFLKALEKKLRSLGYQGLAVNRDTSRSPDVLDFMKDRKGWILSNKPDFILISPSAESGVDINLSGYFGACYCLFFGILGTDSQKQMMMRLRDISIPRYVWIAPFSFAIDNINARYDKHHILAKMIQEINLNETEAPGDILASLSEFIDSLPQAYWGLLASFHKIKQYEFFNPRGAFLESAKDGGYSIIESEMDSQPKIGSEIRAIKKAIKEDDCERIAKASDKFIGKPNYLPSLEDLNNPEIMAAIEKAKLCAPFPNIQYSDLWGADLAAFLINNPAIASKRRRYILAKNIDIAKRYSIRKNSLNLEGLKLRGLAPYQLKADFLVAKAIQASGILELIDSKKPYNADSPQALEIFNNCSKKAIYSALEKKPSYPIKHINWLLRYLGFFIREKDIKKDKEVFRLYWLSRSYDDFLALIDEIIFNQIYSAAALAEDSPRPIKPEQIILWDGIPYYFLEKNGESALLGKVSDFSLLYIPTNEFPYSIAA